MTVKRLIVGGALVAVIGFVAIQLVPYGRDHANPPVQSEPAWDSPATATLVAAACNDCHSNRTEWPWYSNIAPFSWLVQHDVQDGRQALNFSEMNLGQAADLAAGKVSSGQMPPFNYTILHPNARLSDADRATLVRGLIATFGGG